MSLGSSLRAPDAASAESSRHPTPKPSLDKLSSLIPPNSGPVIAVDLDDVLSQTNRVVAEWHNEVYETDMDVSQFYYYYYWKNPHWGTPSVTFDKVADFYATDRIHGAPPVPGAREGVAALRALGYRLVVVTARSSGEREGSWAWLEQHFPGMFDTIVCTGQFKSARNEDGAVHEVSTKLSKAEVCADLRALLLIDDSLENAVQCLAHPSPLQVILFGDYQWNKRTSSASDMDDAMSFAARLEREGDGFWRGAEEERAEEMLRADGGEGRVRRVRDWGGVVKWVRGAREEGVL